MNYFFGLDLRNFNLWVLGFSALSTVPIKDFSCGDYYAGALTKDGSLYTWGFGNVKNKRNFVLINVI